jgi:hypothetical protein
MKAETRQAIAKIQQKHTDKILNAKNKKENATSKIKH